MEKKIDIITQYIILILGEEQIILITNKATKNHSGTIT